jgi:hypothetical protein
MGAACIPTPTLDAFAAAFFAAARARDLLGRPGHEHIPALPKPRDF